MVQVELCEANKHELLSYLATSCNTLMLWGCRRNHEGASTAAFAHLDNSELSSCKRMLTICRTG